jgi:hypothetical protein
MPTIIETVGGGEVSAGFLDRDLSKVQLGELPPITVRQFAGFAALALTEGVFPMLNPETRREWAKDVSHMARQVGALSLKQGDNVTEENMGKPLELPTGADEKPRFYEHSPFVMLEAGQRVGFAEPGDSIKHVVSSEDFFGLTYEVIYGGIMGWGAHGGTYSEVQNAATLLDSALSAY